MPPPGVSGSPPWQLFARGATATRAKQIRRGIFFDKMAPYVAKMTQGWNGARGTAS